MRPVRVACTSTPPNSSKPTFSPVATSTTRGEVTARHEPRTCTTKSLMAAVKLDAPKLCPTMAVATGTAWLRWAISIIEDNSAKPSADIMSGTLAPPVWPKYTKG